jgi:hypothetical protein
MLLKEISEARLKFYIISDVEELSNGNEILLTLRNSQFKSTNEEVCFLELEPYERFKHNKVVSCYMGVFNSSLVIKDIGFNFIHSERYVKKLSELFPNKVITRLVAAQIEGDKSVTGGILQSFLNNEMILHLRNIGQGNNDIIYDRNEEYIAKQDRDGKESDKEFVLSLINMVLEDKLKSNSLNRFNINRYELIKFNDFNSKDKYSELILKHFPKIDDTEISSAWVARELRAMLSNNNKMILFPSAKEIIEIIVNIISELLDDSFKYYHSRKTFRRKTKNFTNEVIIGGNDRTGFSIIFKKSFPQIENQIKEIGKAINSVETNRKVTITKFVDHYMEDKLSLGNSWNNFATQLYYHLKFGFEHLFPMFEKFSEPEYLHNYINEENNWFTGGEFNYKQSKPMIENYIVAVNANSELANKLLEEQVLKFVNQEDFDKYKSELEKLKPADNNP